MKQLLRDKNEVTISVIPLIQTTEQGLPLFCHSVKSHTGQIKRLFATAILILLVFRNTKMWGTALNTNIKTLLNAAQFPKDLSLQNFSTQLQFKRLEWYSDKRCEKILDQVNRQDFYCQLSTFKKQTAFSLKKTRNNFLTPFSLYWKKNILIQFWSHSSVHEMLKLMQKHPRWVSLWDCTTLEGPWADEEHHRWALQRKLHPQL